MFCLTCKRISLGGTNFTYTVWIDLLQTCLFNRGKLRANEGPTPGFLFRILKSTYKNRIIDLSRFLP